MAISKNRKEYLKQYHKKASRTTKGRYAVISRSAKRRRLEIVSYDLLKPFLEQPCYYCGEWSAGLDRIDNKLGYLVANVLPCCTRCNITRNYFWTVEEAKIMVAAALKYRKKNKLK